MRGSGRASRRRTSSPPRGPRPRRDRDAAGGRSSTAELPGVDPASIDLSVTGNVLTLRGEKRPGEIPEGSRPVRERVFGPFHRQVILPGEVNFEGVQAEARDGVLQGPAPEAGRGPAADDPVQPERDADR